jgi:hypothetical protein
MGRDFAEYSNRRARPRSPRGQASFMQKNVPKYTPPWGADRVAVGGEFPAPGVRMRSAMLAKRRCRQVPQQRARPDRSAHPPGAPVSAIYLSAE